MKKGTFVLYFICMCFSLQAQDANIIGKIVNGKPTLTANADLLCKALSKNLATASNIKEDFKTVELLKSDTSYILVFRGSKYKTTFRASSYNNILKVSPKTSCTTSDATCSKDPDACVPSGGVGQCACSGCPGNATCTKTCSDTSLLE
jgi:hypothetical protein